MLKSIGDKMSKVTQSDKYGESLHFISFYCSVLARLAYMNDTTFLTNYCKIFGNQNIVIPTNILEIINKNSGTNNIFKKTDLEIVGEQDQNISQNALMDKINITQYAKKINVINGEVSPELGHLVDANGNPIDISISTDDSKRIKYISIGTSNYGEIYILTDTKMPNVILVVFRGTYSAKTTNSWLKPSSTIPLESEGDKYMKGIYKITMELFNTIIESMRYLTKDSEQDNINIITTGHSLGGAMSTIFAYKWVKLPQEKRPNKISDKITCVSLGAPRIFSKETSINFCNYASNQNEETQKIFYLRIVTRGDPVASLPPKALNFSHPCSSNGEEFRKSVYESCNSTYTATMAMNYDGNLDCQNFERRLYVTNPLSHTNYVQIKYLSAVDISAFLKSGASVKTTEVARNSQNNNATVCRLIYFNGVANVGEEFKVIFFDMNKARGQNVDDKGEEDKLSSEVKTVNTDDVKDEGQSGGYFWNIGKPTQTQKPQQAIQLTQQPTQTQQTQQTQQPQQAQQATQTQQPQQAIQQTQQPTSQPPQTQQPTQQAIQQQSKSSTISKMMKFDVPKDKNVTTEIFERMMVEMKPMQTIPTIAKLPLKSNNIFVDFPNIQEQAQTGGNRTRRNKNKKYKNRNRKTKRRMFNKRRTNKRIRRRNK